MDDALLRQLIEETRATMDAVRSHVVDDRAVHDAVIKLTVIQGQHEKLLEMLLRDREENTKLKAKIGGVVLATTVVVSAAWGLLLALVKYFPFK